MAKTLLNAVNDTLKRLAYIKGNSGELSSLTDSQRQVMIDLAVASWNETIIDLYDVSELQFPNEMATATITLVTSTRAYVLPSDLTFIRFPLINTTNGYTIEAYPGGWEQMRRDQLQPSNYTGRPNYGVVRPSDGYLYLDRIPQSADNGLAYTLTYDKSLLMAVAADTVPFNNDIYTALIPAVVEKIKMERDEQNDTKYAVSAKKYRTSLGKAASMLMQQQPKTSYAARRYGANMIPNPSDPLEG